MHQSKLFWTSLILIIFFHQKISGQEENSTYKNVSFQSVEISDYRNVISPCVYMDSCLVFEFPDTDSPIKEVLPFHTYVKILGEGDDSGEINTQKFFPTGESYTEKKYTNLHWYKVESSSGVGYAKASDISLHTLGDDKGLFTYFIYCSDACYVYVYDIQLKQFTDTLKIESMRDDIVHTIPIEGWKNADILFRINMINAYCGGGIFDAFVIHADGKLSLLISTQSYADDGSAEGYSSMVWLPVSFANKKVLLIENGDVDHVFDTYTGKLKTKSYPKGLTIPINELIIFKETEYHGVYDSKGDPVLSEDGSYKSGQIKNKSKYFQWNGAKLVPIK